MADVHDAGYGLQQYPSYLLAAHQQQNQLGYSKLVSKQPVKQTQSLARLAG